MTAADLWSARAAAFRESPTHREGADLDLLVEWCEPASGVTALDVATGGGHVARRLRERGCKVVTLDPAPGMGADVVAHAEDLPFANASFDVVTCRIAPHHFADVGAAVREMARVSRRLVVLEDNVFVDARVEEAERLRDPTHVRCYGEDEWRDLFEAAGLTVDRLERVERPRSLDDWLARVDTPEGEAARVRELVAHRVQEGVLTLYAVLLRGVKRGG